MRCLFLSNTIFLLSFYVHGLKADQSNTGILRKVLHDLQHLMEGEGNGRSDNSLYPDIVKCFNKFDPTMLPTHEAAWKGFLEYSSIRGNNNHTVVEDYLGATLAEDSFGTTPEDKEYDPWMQCRNETRNVSRPLRWSESNCTMTLLNNVSTSIHEPCNAASNIAYYYAMLEVCHKKNWSFNDEHVTALVWSYSLLAQGSIFFHASQTKLGGRTDMTMMNLFALVNYQAAMSSLNISEDNSALFHLNNTPRAQSGAEIAMELGKIYTDLPVTEWRYALKDLDIPSFILSICAFLSLAFSMVMSQSMVETAIGLLLHKLDLGYGSRDAKFCLTVVMPQLINATSDIHLDRRTHFALSRGVAGTLSKFAFGVWWQEELMPGSPLVFSSWSNRIGHTLLPIVNSLGNFILPTSHFKYKNDAFYSGTDLYPGEKWCGPGPYPHAKWHQQSAIGLTDLTFLADYIHDCISKQNSMK